MRARSGESRDGMGATVTRTASAVRGNTPPLKNGSDLRESGYLIAVGSRTARFRRKHKERILLLILLMLVIFLLCLSIVTTALFIKHKRIKPVRLCESKQCLRSAANLALSMDLSVDPCDDFYQYVCGNWADDHPRPDSYRSYDWFREKQTKVYTLVRDFLSLNITFPAKPVQQAKDMFLACMDTDILDKRGLKPVIKVLESLGLPPYPTYINDTEDFDYSTYEFDWLETVIKVKTKLGMDVLIGFDIFSDPKNSSVYRLVMGSPETTNPFPSVHNEKKRHTKRKLGRLYFYEDFISILNSKYNYEVNKDKEGDEDKAGHVYKLFYAQIIKLFYLESEAKKSKLTEVELDQNIFVAANEHYTMDNDLYELETVNDTESDESLYANIPEYTIDNIQDHTDMIVENNNGTATLIWKRYLEGVFAVSDVTLDFEKDKILVSAPDLKYMSLMASLLSKTPPVAIELYIWIKVVEVMAVHTTSELRTLFIKSYDELHGRSASEPPRSLQCASAVNDMLGMAVAYAIADRRFLNVTKPKIQTMIFQLKNALAHLVGQAKWMDDDTKLATYKKIIEMRTLIGFPDWLLQKESLEKYYEGIEVNIETHLENLINIVQVKIKKGLNRYREGNNFTWATDPTEVNAYHTFQENTITIPLVMLQYPFFDLGLDSLNYGSLGTVLGHEITHGFDNYGRLFDRNGNLLPWWSNSTVDSFVNKSQCFIDQYSNYYVTEVDEHVDGKRTLGENIADNGGVREALAALKIHLRKYGPEAKLPGFEDMTSEQLFFLSYGNLWCGVTTIESLKADLNDEHSPQKFRAKGALQNNEDFAKAWNCPPESSMNPTEKCVIF